MEIILIILSLLHYFLIAAMRSILRSIWISKSAPVRKTNFQWLFRHLIGLPVRTRPWQSRDLSRFNSPASRYKDIQNFHNCWIQFLNEYSLNIKENSYFGNFRQKPPFGNCRCTRTYFLISADDSRLTCVGKYRSLRT